MIVATLTYIRKQGKTLMLHRNKKDQDYHEGKYNGIGGKLESGESPEQCAFREIKEETGLVAEALTYRGHLSFPCFDGVNDWLCFVYECRDFHGDIAECDEGTLHWVPDDQILSLPLWEGDGHFLKLLYQTDEIFQGVFTYRDKALVDYQITRGITLQAPVTQTKTTTI